MRITYVLPFYDPDTPTHYAHLYDMVEALASREDVFLIVGEAKGLPTRFAATHVVVLPKGRILRLLGYARALARAAKLGYRRTYVHYHVAAAVLAILIARVRGGSAYFWSCIRVKRYFAPWSPRPKALARKLFVDLPMTWVFRKTHGLITCSEFMADYFTKEFDIDTHRIAVLPNWVDVSRFESEKSSAKELRDSLRLPASGPIVLYLHTVSEHRGAHLLCEIAARIRKDIPDATLLVAGDGDYAPKLREEIARRGLANAIRCVGPVPQRDTPKWLRATDVLINPALDEAFGRILLEAMAAGVPFVSTDGGGGVLAFVGPHQRQCVVPPGDVATFADAIVRVLEDGALRARLVAEGKAIARQHDLPLAVERFARIVGGGSA